MKILVAVKRVVDANVKVRLKADCSDVEIGAAKMSINPFDENAVEAALRLKEAGHATEIVAVSVGPAATQDTLRHALAMGADRAILVDSGADMTVDALNTAKLLRAVIEREQPQLILLGKQAIDDDAAVTGPLLAGLLKLPQAVAASAIELEGAALRVVREVEGGQQTLSVPLPAVITADLRLNDPRYVKLPNLMMARKKPIETLTPADLNQAVTPRQRLLSVAEPAVRAAGQRVNNVDELISRLRNEAKVLP